MINSNQLLTDADDICNEKPDITTKKYYNRFFDQFKEWVVQNHYEYVEQTGAVGPIGAVGPDRRI